MQQDNWINGDVFKIIIFYNINVCCTYFVMMRFLYYNLNGLQPFYLDIEKYRQPSRIDPAP